MNKKKILNLIGVIVGVVTIILGIVFICDPAETYSTYTPDEASFGADFYTYEYEATRMAAVNAATTARNLRELSYKLAFYTGSTFIIAGLLILICFLKEILCNKPLKKCSGFSERQENQVPQESAKTAANELKPIDDSTNEL